MSLLFSTQVLLKIQPTAILELCHIHVCITCLVTLLCGCIKITNDVPTVIIQNVLRLLESYKKVIGWCTHCSV